MLQDEVQCQKDVRCREYKSAVIKVAPIKMIKYILYAVILTSGILCTNGEKILVIFPVPARSHIISFTPYVEELVKRGHEVTVVTPFPRKTPLANFTEIVYEDTFPRRDSPGMNLFEHAKGSAITKLFFLSKILFECCEKFLEQPNIQKLIHSSDLQFDLVIYEPFFAECTYGLIHKFKAPTIQIAPNTIITLMGNAVGNPNIFSYMPQIMLGYTHRMTFIERMHNTLLESFTYLFRYCYALPKMETLMRKYFDDPTLPTVQELEQKTSFLLLNSHVSLNYPRPLTPNTAEVGGMHIKSPQKLPQDLQKILDESPDGAIYFSLGSNVRSVDMPEEMRNALLKVFSTMKQRILWKWEDDVLPGKPKNVYLRKWFPQHDILAHPKIKAFITHGGLFSIQEATYFGVPLVAIPIMAEQEYNALGAEQRGYAVILHFRNITEASLKWALDEVLNEPKYAANANHLSNLFNDRPQKPLDTAIFWTEYVIRTKGAPHMKSAALDLNFFQYYVLDVLGVLLMIITGVCLVIFMVVCKVFKFIKGDKRKTKYMMQKEKKHK